MANPTMVQMAASYLVGMDEGASGHEMPSVAGALGAGAFSSQIVHLLYRDLNLQLVEARK